MKTFNSNRLRNKFRDMMQEGIAPISEADLMNTLENIYIFNTRNFTVQVDAMEEIDPDFSFDETGEAQDMVNRGDWLCFSVKVSVLFNGNEIASEYLGNCIYENFRDFRDNVGSKGKHGSYFTDMIRQAISDARKEIETIQSVKLRK